jgi:hypothetical protein
MIMEVIRVWKERKDFLRSIQERFYTFLLMSTKTQQRAERDY